MLVHQKFLVADTGGEVLLGMDFFKDNSCVLDFEMAKLQLSNYKVSCVDRSGAPCIKRVQVSPEIRIPPRSEIVVEGRLNLAAVGCTGLVEPKHQIHSLTVAATVHQPTGLKMAIRLCNMGTEEMIIPAGKIIGRFILVDGVGDPQLEIENQEGKL